MDDPPAEILAAFNGKDQRNRCLFRVARQSTRMVVCQSDGCESADVSPLHKKTAGRSNVDRMGSIRGSQLEHNIYPGIGTSRHCRFKSISTRDVGVNSRCNRRTGARSVDARLFGRKLIKIPPGRNEPCSRLSPEGSQVPVNRRYHDGPFSDR